MAGIALLGCLACAAPAGAANYCAIKATDPLTGCTTTFTDAPGSPAVQNAINQADATAGNDTVTIGAGTFSTTVSSGFGSNPSTAGSLTITGQGAGTTLTGPTAPAAGSHVLRAYSASATNPITIQNLAIQIPGTGNLQVTGLEAIGTQPTAITNVSVTSAASSRQNIVGVLLYDGDTLTNGTVTLPQGGQSGNNSNLAVNLQGTTSANRPVVQDSVLRADYGAAVGPVATSGLHYGRVLRTRISAASGVATTNGGDIDIQDSLINLLPDVTTPVPFASSGLDAFTFNGTDPGTIEADHVTVIGGAATTDYGGRSFASGSGTSANLDVTNSVFANVEKSYRRFADSFGMATGSISYSDYNPLTVEDSNNAGGVGIFSVEAGNVNLDPGFSNAASGDYSLSATSPLIDIGDPAALGVGESATDLAGNARIADGNDDGTSRRDIGAFERPAPVVMPPPPPPDVDTTPPNTKAGKFTKKTRKHSLKLRFSSTEAGSTFTCKLDKGKAKACKSPYTAKGLKVGTHVLVVVATDAAGNADPTPAKLKFKVLKKTKRHNR